MPRHGSLYKFATHELLDALTWRVSNKTYKSIKDLELLDARLQRLTAVVRGKRNLLVPINQLPTELLVAIFSYTQQHLESFLPTPPNGSAYDKHHLDWLVLLQVCRHWRSIAATSSSLWSAIDNGYIPDKFLKRSGTVPISIYCGIRVRSFPKKDLQMYFSHLPRIREFHADVSKWTDSIQDLYDMISKPAPMLESLTLDTMGTVSQPTAQLGEIFSSLSGGMPRLRKLCLEYFSYWPAGQFTKLTHLCLHHQPFPESSRPTTAQFLDVLETCPDLEELALVSAGPTRSEMEDVPSPHAGRLVPLHKLREFTWGKIADLTWVRRLLGFLSLPESTRLYFWGCSIFSGNDGDVANLIPGNLANLPCMLGLEEWRLRCLPYSTLSSGRDSYVIAFENKILYTLDVATEAHLSRVPSVYAPVLRNVKRLYVQDGIDLSTNLWQDIFCCLPLLEELRMKPHLAWNAARGVLAALFPEPQAHSPTSVRTGLKSMLGLEGVLCPKLKHLSFEVASGIQGPGFYISTFANARKNEGHPLDLLELRYIRPPIPLVERRSPSPPPPLPLPPNTAPAPTTSTQAAPPPPLVIQHSQEQTFLETESMRVAAAAVKDVVYLNDQDPLSYEPKFWPTRAYTWTTMAIPEDDG